MNKSIGGSMDLVDFIRVSGESENTGELVREFINFLGSFGVGCFFMIDLLSGMTADTGKKFEVRECYPEYRIKESLMRTKVEYVPVFDDAFKTGKHVLWDDVLFKDDGKILFNRYSGSVEPEFCKGVGFVLNQPAGGRVGMIFIGTDGCIKSDKYNLSLIHAASYQFCLVYAFITGSCLSTGNIRITEREKDVLLWIANGKSKSETAGILSISESAVKRHCENIFLKLDVNTLPSAVAKALTMGLIELC